LRIRCCNGPVDHRPILQTSLAGAVGFRERNAAFPSLRPALADPCKSRPGCLRTTRGRHRGYSSAPGSHDRPRRGSCVGSYVRGQGFALLLAKETSFDVALLDFNMPGRDGLELAAELLALHPSTPLAVVSANHQEEIVGRAKDIGAAFLTKPLNEQALGAFLADAIRRLERTKA
jgi:CheY-like chemotaxis protein